MPGHWAAIPPLRFPASIAEAQCERAWGMAITVRWFDSPDRRCLCAGDKGYDLMP